MAKPKSSASPASVLFKPPIGIIFFALVFGAIGYAVRTLTHAAPANSSGSSITLSTTDPHLGGIVKFATSYPKITGNVSVLVGVYCYQDVDHDGIINTNNANNNQDLVYGELRSAVDASNTGFTLGGSSSVWLNSGGGPATCNANLFYYRFGGRQGETYNFLAKTPDWQAAGAN